MILHIHGDFCLLFYVVLTTSKVTSVWVPACGSAHSWQLYSAASLGNQAISTMTWYPTQSHYPEPNSPCPILITLSTWLGSDNYHFISPLFDFSMGSSPRLPTRETSALQIWPPRLVPWRLYSAVPRPPDIPLSNIIQSLNAKTTKGVWFTNHTFSQNI